MSKAIAFLVVLLISPAAYAATTHIVGGSSGWNTGFNYDNWASGQTFNVGDSLLFNYGPTHALDEVNQADYQSCNTGNSLSSYSSSPTNVTIPTAGTRYFICPRSNHCSIGMKLTVTVAAGGTTPMPPSGTTPSGSPGTPTTTAPPPPSSGATKVLDGSNILILVGLSLVSVIMVGLVG